jgi:lauroyl/myristoyl acyltransferase
VLIVIIDAPPGPRDRRAWAPFLGGRLLVSPGAVRLARRTGAALVPYFAVEEDGRLIGRIEPEVEVRGLDDAAALGPVFAPLARMVERYPEQWWLWEAVPALWRPDADTVAG